MTFAIVKTGGKQYKVTPGEKIRVEKLDAEVGKEVLLDQVLLKAEGEKVAIGTPYLSNVSVSAKVTEQSRDKKKIVFRYHPKTRYRRKNTHRQPYTELEITSV